MDERVQRRRLTAMSVDDDVVSTELMRAIFEFRPEWELQTFTSAGDALASLDGPGTIAPDLLLLDIEMPVTDGLSLLRELREKVDCSAMRCVVISASAYPEGVSAARAIGVTQYLVKPADVESILHQIDQAALQIGVTRP